MLWENTATGTELPHDFCAAAAQRCACFIYVSKMYFYVIFTNIMNNGLVLCPAMIWAIRASRNKSFWKFVVDRLGHPPQHNWGW